MSGKRRAYPSMQYPATEPVATGGSFGYGQQPGAQAYGQQFTPGSGLAGQQLPGATQPNLNGQGAPYGAPGGDQLAQGMSSLNIQQNQQPQPVHQFPAQQQGYINPGAGLGVPPTQAAGPYGVPAAVAPQQQSAQLGYAGPPYGNTYDQQQPQQAAFPFNQLYTADLLKELPPPISDLELPPPPIVLPQGASLTGKPESNASPEYFRCTLNVIPNNNSLLKKSKLPLAVVVNPYQCLRDEDEPVPVVEDTLISRCRRCRSYINPLITFVDRNTKWRCNLCNLTNDVPSGFDFDKDTQQRVDRMARVELNYSVVEFVAPKEYMVRLPQPLVYLFVLDVSTHAIQNGYLATVARTILDSLDQIPNKDGRARVGFIGVDSSLHFFTIPQDSEDENDVQETSMLVVSDLDDVIVPAAENLLAPLQQSRQNIENLLNNFHSYFENNVNPNFALGPALKAGHRLINNIGGKMIVFTSTLPNKGIGALSIRDEEAHSGKAKESSALLSPNDSFYKSFAVECNKSQVTVDMFLASSSYQDVATLSNLPRYTAGQTHFYPAWTAAREEDITKLSKEISNHLSMNINLEAVLRVRGSAGLRMNAFYGNFFNRSSDLCSFPTFPRDQSYLIEISIDEHITKPLAAFQAAVLHTTSFGERRIRVMTLEVPIGKELNQIYASADQLAITNYFTHKAVEKALSSTLVDAREYLNRSLLDIFQVFKKELVAGNLGSSSPLQLCNNLKMLPLLLHSLTKYIAFRPGKVPSDHRAYALNLLASSPIQRLIKFIYPTIYSLHDMADECGLPEELEATYVNEAGEEVTEPIDGDIVLPEPINDTSTLLAPYGLYLIDSGTDLFLYVGGESVPQLLLDVFGVDNPGYIKYGKSDLPELNNEFNERLRNVINRVREGKDRITYQNLQIVIGQSKQRTGVPDRIQEDLTPLRLWCFSHLVEDRVGGGTAYREYLNQIREKLSS
ncbi:COPII subunit [Komagataella kurtzmanii]|nr:COPII subunit [Komagataella kurtzmanii]